MTSHAHRHTKESTMRQLTHTEAYSLPSRMAAPTLDIAESASSCGWYESSFDLQAGLEVTEERDAVLAQLWLQATSCNPSH
jgi:hypothetical protein